MVTAADYLNALALAYLGVAALVVCVVVWIVKGLRRKLVWGGIVLAVFAVWPMTSIVNRHRDASVLKAKLDKAIAHFEMRCKGAGEKINRTVDNVEGVVWMKWRDKYDVNDDYDQFKLSDPYGRDCNAEQCIEQLLRATQGFELDTRNEQANARVGFKYAESIDPSSQQPTRYTRNIYRQRDRDPKFAEWATATELVPARTPQLSARYGITWDDISTRDDREHWIAGGSLRVIDLKTNEVIAERIGYMMDRGQGDASLGRSPWQMARRSACPAFPEGQFRYPTKDSVLFLLKVLKPTQEK